MNTIVVVNNTARDYVLPTPPSHKADGEKGDVYTGTRLKPGANAVPEALIQELLDAKKGGGKEVQTYFERGDLTFQEERHKTQANKVSAKEAIALIAKCKDPQELVRISLMDVRPTVRKAVEDRLIVLEKDRNAADSIGPEGDEE